MSDQRINIAPQGDSIHVINSVASVFAYSGFHYDVIDIESIITFVRRYGSLENTLIFVNENRVMTILDNSIEDRDKDRVSCKFDMSDEIQCWQQGCLTQKGFILFLKSRPEYELENYEALLAAVRVLKIATETTGNYEYDDHGNITFLYKTKDKEGVCSIPSVLNLHIPILLGRDPENVEMELEIIKPKSENEKPGFSITCPRLLAYYKAAVKAEVEKIKSELSEFMIIAG